MSTVELEAKLEDLPERWRKGRTLRDGDVLVVTVKQEVDDTRNSFWDVAHDVAGVWAGRSDEEIDEWQSDMRAARKRRFETLFPDTE